MDVKALKPNYTDWPREQVAVADLFLDPENIRLVDVEPSQEALINDLFENENAMQVLESIADNGLFPDELPVVIKENNKIFVIEGNRRIAALKVLSRPAILPNREASVKQLIKITGASGIKKIEVVVAPDRESVRHFLASKHTQNTRRPWRPLRQAYFYKAELKMGKSVQDLKNEYPSVDIDKFLRYINIHRIAKSIQYDSDVLTRKIYNERTFPATTIERLYEDKQVRDFLGFNFDKNGEVTITINKSEFEKGFKKMAQDVAGKYADGFGAVDSRTLNDEKKRKAYLESFPRAEVPKKTKSDQVTTSKDFKELAPTNLNKRSKLAPRDIKFALPCAGVRRMLVELQEIDYRKFPNATHDLLRSFLECGLKAYFQTIGKTIVAGRGRTYVYLDDVLQEFIQEMDTQKNNRMKQVAARIKGNANMTSYSALFLNATNHNPDVFVTPKEVEDAWDAMDPLFRHILNPTTQTKNAQNKPQTKSKVPLQSS